jgi:ferric-dicitrate binding protein FerR (iron transport regulator)
VDREIFIRHFAGTLSPKEENALWEWLDASSEHRNEYLEWRRTWDMYLLHTPAGEPSVSFERLLDRRSRKATDAVRPSAPIVWLRRMGGAAAIFLIAFGLAWYLHASREQMSVWHTIEVPSGQRVKLTLADGSIVWLNAQTRFTYPALFGKHDRRVTLDGEGLFEIARDARRPFTVQTGRYNVTALGTTFDVYAYGNSDAFETVLVDGIVDVDVPDTDGPTKRYRMQPGYKFLYDAALQKTRVLPVVNTNDYISWTNGIYYFNDITFAEMAERLAHYYKTQIIINDSSIMNYRCTGKFRQYESITDILDVVKSDMPFSYSYDRDLNKLTIRKRGKRNMRETGN